jgi:basic membrane protein A
MHRQPAVAGYFYQGSSSALKDQVERFLTPGAKKINPQVTVLANFVGVTSEAWNNPPKGKELALSQYEAGAM